MTKKKLENIARRILPELPGFIVQGPMLLRVPIRYNLCAIYFDRSIDPKIFYCQIFVQPLFVPCNTLSFNVGWRLSEPNIQWNINQDDLVSTLATALREYAIPFLMSAESLDGCASVAASLGKSGDPHVQQTIAYAEAFAGRYREALQDLDRLEGLLDGRTAWHQRMAEEARLVRADVLSNKQRLHERFNRWRYETAAKLSVVEYLVDSDNECPSQHMLEGE